MIICHRYKFIFVKTGKTAGTSIEVALDPLVGEDAVVTPFSRDEPGHRPRNYRGRFNPCPEIAIKLRRGGPHRQLRATRDDLRYNRRFWHHLPAWQIRARAPKMWRDYFTFCVERDPWEKVISGWAWYRAKHNADITVGAYLDLLEQRIVTRRAGVGVCPFNLPVYTDPLSSEVIVDQVIRYEQLGEQLRSTLEDGLGVPMAWPLPTAKGNVRSPASSPVEMMSPAQMGRVADLFAEEITLHGYAASG